MIRCWPQQAHRPSRGPHTAQYQSWSRCCRVHRCLPHPAQTGGESACHQSVQLWQPLAGSLAEVRRVVRPGGRLVLGVHERACCPVAAPQAARFDDVLLPVLQAARFPVTDAGCRQTRGGQAFLCHALRPAGP